MKNVLLIMTDQQRFDYVGYSKKVNIDTPNIDYIASYANFTCCNTTNPICTPSRTSLITGRYTRQIGTLTMSGDLFPQIPTFMQVLQKNGYKTYGIGKFHYLQTWDWNIKRGEGSNSLEEECKQFGYDFIFETAGKQQVVKNYCHYCDCLNKKGMLNNVRDFAIESGGGNGDLACHNYDKCLPWKFETKDYIDVVTADIAKDKLKNHDKNQPFFMKVSFCGPHKPYDPPKEYLDATPYEEIDDFNLQDGQTLSEQEKRIIYKQRQASKAMIKLIDDQIGEIFSILRQNNTFDDTLIIFTSDHGDMLGDHYMIQKGVPWKESTNIPLAIKLPHSKKIGTNNSPVEISDIAATILDWVGLNPRESLSRSWPAYNDIIPSKSLLPILNGDQQKIRDFCFSESDFTEERADGTDINQIIALRGEGRTNAWQSIITDEYKYIKYLKYDIPGKYHEEFYDLRNDPSELNNLVNNNSYDCIIRLFKDRLMYVLDTYPPAQKTWAKVNAKDIEIN